MRLLRSYKDMRRAEVRTVGWFFAVMGIVTVMFALIVAAHYLLSW